MPVASAPPAEGAADAAFRGTLPDFAASTSALTTRPCGPDPEIADSSIPASLAIRRANGDANTRAAPLALPPPPPDPVPCIGAAALPVTAVGILPTSGAFAA